MRTASTGRCASSSRKVGVTSQREIEKVVREHSAQGGTLRLRMVLTSPDAPALNHVVEQTIPLA